LSAGRRVDVHAVPASMVDGEFPVEGGEERHHEGVVER
jgi:hypothetical protein